MSLIKAVDVPKHMADRLQSRRIAARLTHTPVKGTSRNEKKPLTPSDRSQ